MIRKQKTFNDCRYPEEVKRLFKVAMDNGIILLTSELESLWEEFSESCGSSWLNVDNYGDDLLIQIIQTGDLDD